MDITWDYHTNVFYMSPHIIVGLFLIVYTII